MPSHQSTTKACESSDPEITAAATRDSQLKVPPLSDAQLAIVEGADPRAAERYKAAKCMADEAQQSPDKK